MDRFFIIGAGGFGREVYSWLKQTPAWGEAWQFAGFLDGNPDALESDFPASVVGDPRSFLPRPGDQMVCAIGQSRVRLEICELLRARGATFPIVRHPSVVVGEKCRIGQGCVLCPGAVLTTNVRMGAYVIVNVHSSIGHDAVIGDGVTLSGHVDLTGFVEAGEGAFFGSHACVLPRGKIGNYARVGAGSVVLRTVEAGTSVMGVPARQIYP